MSGAPDGRDSPGFRPDLEGLRAVAVVLVLLFHAEVPGFAGGYVGVDVFFVLSGFLITGLLVRELSSTGRISLPAFYARRARRLLPAAALALAATAIASAVILPPLRMPDVAGDIAAAALYVSNIRFALQATDYLASDLPPSPVLHFWSLGVEEQFYLFWPALLALATGAAFVAGDVARGVRRVTATLGVVFVLSLVAAVWLTGVQQPWAFFSLPTRAWELALGGLLAMPVAARLVPARAAGLVGWAGLALVLASGVVLDESTPFPGVAALLPTVGSAFVIAAGLSRAGRAAQRIPGPSPFLSLSPVRYLGRISYSLYLWHWPILVLPAVALGHIPGVGRLALVGLSVVIAAASQRWVEEPIRHGKLMGTNPRRVLAIAGALSMTVAVSAIALGAVSTTRAAPAGPNVGGGIEDVSLPPVALATPRPTSQPTPPLTGQATPPLTGEGGGPTSSPGSSAAPPTHTPTPTLPPLAAAPVPGDLAPALTAAENDLPVIYSDGCHVDPPSTSSPDCVFGDASSKTTVVVFGDSHMAQWFPAFERLATEHGWRLQTFTKSACASVDVPVWSTLFDRPYTECTAWREDAIARIAAEHPALVVVANDRQYALALDGGMAWSTDHEDVWAAGLARTLTTLKQDASAVLLLGDTVRMSQDPPVCLSDHLDDASACATPFRTAAALDRNRRDAATAAAVGVQFLDPTPFQCFTDPCPAVIGRFLVYRDTHHMTATYSRALAEHLYEDLPPIAQDGQAIR